MHFEIIRLRVIIEQKRGPPGGVFQGELNQGHVLLIRELSNNNEWMKFINNNNENPSIVDNNISIVIDFMNTFPLIDLKKREQYPI